MKVTSNKIMQETLTPHETIEVAVMSVITQGIKRSLTRAPLISVVSAPSQPAKEVPSISLEKSMGDD
jgi:hypothetical protein